MLENTLHHTRADAELPADLEDKHLRQFQDGALHLDLLIPFRPDAQPTEYSSIEIRYGCLKVFGIRWDKAGSFKVVTLKPGEWSKAARARLADCRRRHSRKVLVSRA